MTTVKIIKLGEKYSEKYELTDAEKALLIKIERGKYHMISKDDLTNHDVAALKNLLSKKMIRHVKEHGIFPEGFSVTSGGSYALGTFDSSDYY